MFRMVRVPNIALMAMLAGLIAAAGLLLYMSPQASAQAPGPCTGLHRYQPHFYGCMSGLITGQAGTLSVEANASLREDFTVTVSIDHDWSLGSELGDTGWRLDAVEVHYYVVSGADRERGWFDVADATSSVSRSYFIEAGRVSYHYSATLGEIDPEPGPVYNKFYVPGGEPVPFDKPYPPRLPWAAGSTATTTPTLSSYPTAAPTQRLQRTSRSARRRPQGADGGRRPGRTPAGSARGPRSTRPRSANGRCSGTITAVPGVNAGTHRPPLAAGAMGAVMTKARHLPHAGAGGSQPRGFGRVSVGRTHLPRTVLRQDAGTAACGARLRRFGPHVDGERCAALAGG